MKTIPDAPQQSKPQAEESNQTEFQFERMDLEAELARPLYYGLLGDFARLIAPKSEADPLAIYVQMLVIFGNCVGHSPHFLLEATPQHANLYACLFGPTAMGRKGTALNRAKQPFRELFAQYALCNWGSGASTGEGIIERLKDDEGGDSTPKDKRLLLLEPEFSGILTAMSRDQNIFSQDLRNAWDNEPLERIRRHNPQVATGCHVSMITHITQDELRKKFTEVDIFNGFANRILWFSVRRSQVLPFGGNISSQAWQELMARLKVIVAKASRIGVMDLDLEARAYWDGLYRKLTCINYPGSLGAVSNRATTQVVRVAMILALTDGMSLITLAHLKAALALWNRSFDAVFEFFAYKTRTKNAQTLVEALTKAGSRGLSETEVSGVFYGNLKSGQLGAVKQELLDLNYARCGPDPSYNGVGRPAHWWHLIRFFRFDE